MGASSPLSRFGARVYAAGDLSNPIRKFETAVYGREDGDEYHTPAEHFETFAEECRRLVRMNYDNLIVIDGMPRKGKSTLGVHLARAIDPSFDVSRVAYTAEEIFRLYRTLPPRSVILNDESALGLLTGGAHRDPELKSLVQALSIVGIKRNTMICCIPDIRMLDTFVKFGRARFWINVYARGLGKVHRCWRGAKYRTSQTRLPYDEHADVSPVGFRSLTRTKFWKEYERDKLDRIARWLEEHEFDPQGRIRVCPKCGLKGPAYNLATHRCPGSAPPAAAPPPANRETPVVDVTARSQRGPPLAAATAPREFRCGNLSFARADVYRRHLGSAAHRAGRCGAALG